MRSTRLLGWFLLLLVATNAQAQTRDHGEWRLVDAVSPGRLIKITMISGETRTGRFQRSSPDELTLLSRNGREDIISKSAVVTVVARRDTRRGAGYGALAGSGGLIAWGLGASSLCGVGCENDVPSAAYLLMGGVGAGLGALVGYAASKTSGPDEVLFPPDRASPEPKTRFPAALVGVTVGRGTFRSYGISGPTTMPSVTTAALLSPRVSVQMEWAKPTSTFLSARASLHEQILSGALPPTSIDRDERHSVRIPYHVAGLVGVHPPAWGRVQLGFLGGLSLAAKEATDISPRQPTLRQHRSPDGGLIVGVDAEVAVLSRLAIVPQVRVDPTFGVRSGVGLSWRF